MKNPKLVQYTNLDILKEMVQSFDENDAEMFIKWAISALENVGIEHNEMCSISRPHSHSADCDCGSDELAEKILHALNR